MRATTAEASARPRLGTAGIVAAYTAVFCVALPAALIHTGLAVDRALGLAAAPTALGLVPAAWGGGLLLRGMAALWTRGRGWPISALPPPKLVIGGPYRTARHPIYLGFNVLMFGIGASIGSLGLAAIVAPLFAPVWVGYALAEERGLRVRFGPAYDRYRRRVGLWPRPDPSPLLRALAAVGAIRVNVRSGAEHVPVDGPAVLIANHTSYADPVFLGLVTARVVWMPATAEAWREGGWRGWIVTNGPAFPVRRYRPDLAAARVLVDLLASGELVGMFVERERSVLGRYLGADPDVAGLLPHLGVPVIPVAIEDAYATGPRWTGRLRARTVHVRIGPPVVWSDRPPTEAVDDALRALADLDGQPVWLEHEPLDRLFRAVWRCPSCLDEAGFRPVALRCEACGAAWTPTGDGRLRSASGELLSFAAWAAPVWAHPEPLPLEVPVRVRHERALTGPPEPLVDDGDATLRIDADGLRWGDHHLAPDAVRSTTTERADTLQVATADAMWQFTTATASPFRMRLALDRARGLA